MGHWFESKAFYPHNPDDLPPRYAPWTISRQHTRAFDAFDEIMSHDKKRLSCKSLGYGISGDTRYECLFLLYGELTQTARNTDKAALLLWAITAERFPETIAQKQNANSGLHRGLGKTGRYPLCQYLEPSVVWC